MRFILNSITPKIPLLSLSRSTHTDAIRSSATARRHTHVISLFIHCHESGHLLDPFTISIALKACPPTKSKPLALSIHSQILKLGLHSNIYTQTALIDTYSKLFDDIMTARMLFDEMHVKNVVTRNTILCAYIRTGCLDKARSIFDEMPVKDIVSWNTMISGYAKAKNMHLAYELFSRLDEKNAASWNGIISGYVCINDMINARKLFDEMPIKNHVSYIIMITAYSKNGHVCTAREIFDLLEARDLSIWNAMLSCYVQNKHTVEAILLFNRMRRIDSNVKLDEVTILNVITACAQMGDLRFGRWVEDYMNCIDILMDDHIRTALVEFYSKCGCIEQASNHFGRLKKKDLVAYSAMINACGVNGRPAEAVRLFKEMLDVDIKPNEVTLVGVLSAYNHAGLVEDARECFTSMWSRYGIKASAVHYAIMVDILGRTGNVEEAYNMIVNMKVKPHAGVWGALLLACRLHGNVELGEIAAKNCVELDTDVTGYYAGLANLYAESGNWEKAKSVRTMMVEKELYKVPACSRA